MTHLHSDAVAALTGFVAPSSGQADLRERYLGHLAAHEHAVWRSCRPDHLTASTIVLSRDGSAVLLTLHAKARRWFQFGGHCEPGDATLQGAAAREALEESGVAGLEFSDLPVHLSEHAVPFCRPDPPTPPDPPGAPPVHHLDVRYAAVAPEGAEHAVSEESLDVRWWPVADLPEPELAELVEAGRAWLAGRAQAGGSTSANSSGGVMAAPCDQPSR